MSEIFTDANFNEQVLNAKQLTVIDFWAVWCPSCIALGPTFDALSSAYQGKVNIGKVNVDENPNISVQFGVTSIPCILFLKDGKVVDRHVGTAPKAVFEKKILQLMNA